MTNVLPANCGVLVVGAGPAGLGVATELARHGFDDVIVLDRESHAGGTPRHCGHYPYGLREFKRLLKGPEYASRLVARASELGVKIFTEHTVLETRPFGEVLVCSNTGTTIVSARFVVLATGIRETPASARLTGGSRFPEIMTTGALQSKVYLHDHIPFKRPVIIGTELVSFSVLLTSKHADIKPVAMLEQGSRVTAWKFSPLLARTTGCRVLTGVKLVSVNGDSHVESVDVRHGDGTVEQLACDGVVFTGLFTPEATLIRQGHLRLSTSTGGPLIDQNGRCSDSAYYAAGNLTRGVETAGWCWQEGVNLAKYLATMLTWESGAHPKGGESKEIPVEIEPGCAISWVLPQQLSLLDAGSTQGKKLHFRVSRKAAGSLELWAGTHCLSRRSIHAFPERRYYVRLPNNIPLDSLNELQLKLIE